MDSAAALECTWSRKDHGSGAGLDAGNAILDKTEAKDMDLVSSLAAGPQGPCAECGRSRWYGTCKAGGLQHRCRGSDKAPGFWMLLGNGQEISTAV
jgi:hypothetical protein